MQWQELYKLYSIVCKYHELRTGHVQYPDRLSTRLLPSLLLSLLVDSPTLHSQDSLRLKTSTFVPR